jgi:hypothetical protein
MVFKTVGDLFPHAGILLGAFLEVQLTSSDHFLLQQYPDSRHREEQL